ncbi:hypothetical protein E2C01_075482 [Portunus trituberculatus]|uniref:Uncharacterized protein n=1 Tax=Portunus trituberculatus TaxID=210409 RepID=A0A5B7IFX3_PORTR|nr:hypothetical protein [Portunus trituberculatus]
MQGLGDERKRRGHGKGERFQEAKGRACRGVQGWECGMQRPGSERRVERAAVQILPRMIWLACSALSITSRNEKALGSGGLL